MNSTLGLNNIDIKIEKVAQNRNLIFGIMLFAALVAFELFNFSTTEFALVDVLGDVTFAGIKWATILSLAFCGIDFAGVAKLFSPSNSKEEPMEVWYLFGSWVLAAGMNATLTWWGVSVAINSHVSQGSAIFSGETIQKVVPVFVAVMVWLIRIMIIGSFSAAGDRLFGTEPNQTSTRRAANLGYNQASAPKTAPLSASAMLNPRPTIKPQYKPFTRGTTDPTYHAVQNNPVD